MNTYDMVRDGDAKLNTIGCDQFAAKPQSMY